MWKQIHVAFLQTIYKSGVNESTAQYISAQTPKYLSYLGPKFFTGPRAHEKTWFEARDYCRAIGGDLLSIHSNTDLYVGR